VSLVVETEASNALNIASGETNLYEILAHIHEFDFIYADDEELKNIILKIKIRN